MCVMCPDDEKNNRIKEQDIMSYPIGSIPEGMDRKRNSKETKQTTPYSVPWVKIPSTRGNLLGQIFKRNEIIQQTNRDPDDEMTQRTAGMKLAMNDPDKMREYYEPPQY